MDWSWEMAPSSAKPGGRSQWIEDSLFAHDLKIIAGADEAGRGACAGPLTVAAVALDSKGVKRLNSIVESLPVRVRTLDSKGIDESERENLFTIIVETALAVEVVIIEPAEIDHFGLQEMNIRAMRRALSQIPLALDYALTDGYAIDGLDIPSLAVWKGDAVSLTVGAASIVAKVSRDRIMIELDHHHPGYGLAQHKGYSTKAHLTAIAERGVLPIHRRSFANIANYVAR
jgi:ribonuclease HII